jgi:hypothetical protein
VLARAQSRLTYANVTATIAVFIALGGGSYAAIKLPSNSVGSKQIKKRAVTPAKVHPRTVRLFKGRKGDKGDPGATGAPGVAGEAGKPGSSAGSAIFSRLSALDNGAGTTYYCPASGDNGSGGCPMSAASILISTPNAAMVGRDLLVRLTTAPGVGAARAFTLMDDGSPTGVTCTVVHPQTSCDSGTATHTFSPGSDVSLRLENSMIAPAPANATVGWRTTTP